MLWLESLETCAAVNAGLEEMYFRRPVDSGGGTLFVYRNSPSVLVGRNQSIWAECDVSFCRERGIALVRRISGGGAVYHDGGNVNVSLIVPKERADRRRFAAALASALAAAGVRGVRVDSHQSVFAGERKICGTACAVGGGHALLHGCILVSADLAMLERALRAPGGPAAAGVFMASNRSPVANVCQLCGADAPAVLAQVRRVFAAVPGGLQDGGAVAATPDSARYAARFADDAWTFSS